MKQKHIVIDGRGLRSSGVGRYIDNLLEHLQKLDTTNRYTVLLTPDDSWQPLAPNFTGIPCPYKRFSLNPLQQITFSFFLYRLGADLLHFTVSGQQPLFYFGRQITLTHDLTMYEYTRPGRLPSWLHSLRMVGYRVLMWSAHQKAKQIITPTNYVREHLAQFQPFTRDKTVTIYEAAEPPISRAAVAPERVKKPFLLYVGTAFPHKNLERLVIAFAKLAEQYPDLQLVLTGKKEFHYGKLEEFTRKNPIGTRVIFTDFVSEGELKWLYRNASVYVFPSLSEGFGLPALEAMAHGGPVASSNATCLPEVYGGAAHYFNPIDIDDMVSKIQDVLEDKSLRTVLIQDGKGQVKKYSWEQMTKETLEVFRKGLDV